MSQDSAAEPKSLSKTTKTEQGEDKVFTPKGSVITSGTKRGEKKIVVKNVVTNITTYTIEFDDKGSKETKETTRNEETVTQGGNSTAGSAPGPTPQTDSAPVSGSGSQPGSREATQKSGLGEDKELRQEVSTQERVERKRDLMNVVDGNQTLPAVRSGTEKGKFHDHGPDAPKKKPASNPNQPAGPFHVHESSRDSSSSTKSGKTRKRTKSEQLRHHEINHVHVHRSHHEGHTKAAKTSPVKSAPPATPRPDATSASSSGGSESSVTSASSEPPSPPRSKKGSQSPATRSRNQGEADQVVKTKEVTRVKKEERRKTKGSRSNDHPSLDI